MVALVKENAGNVFCSLLFLKTNQRCKGAVHFHIAVLNVKTALEGTGLLGQGQLAGFALLAAMTTRLP